MYVVKRMQSGRLLIRDFAQISDVQIQFRDLTVLVGAQGTGKSLDARGDADAE
jgi:DNA repair ATPase RecN